MIAQVVFVIVGVVGLAWLGRRVARNDPNAAIAIEHELARDMRSVPLCRLGAITGDSLVRVVGTARPRDELVTAPLSGRQCVAWAVELYFDGDEKIQRDESEVATFVLESEEATAVVVPPVRVLALVTERLAFDNAAEELPPAAREWIDEHYSGDWEPEQVRLVERRVEAGDRIAVVGWARLDYGDELVGYHAAGELVLFADAEGAPLSISDDPFVLT